jgi:hypothetical protein
LLNRFRSLVLIILSLAFLWSIPGAIGTPTVANLIPKNFEVNAMAVSPHGDVAAGSFYAMDPTVIPWDLTKAIYKDVGVTLIVSNLNASTIASTVGVNIPTQLTSLLPFKIVLIIQGVQTNAPAITSDIESVFGMQSPFLALASNPLTLPVSVYAADVPANQYSNFVNKFVQSTSNKAVVIGQYSASLLETSSSGIFFNSVESLTYPTSPVISAGALDSAIFQSTFDIAFSVNSTGVVVLQKNKLDFSQAQDHTLDFSTVLGLPSALKSTTNETFATVLPGGAQVTSFSPSTMLIQSSDSVTLVLGLFPWVGSAQRTLPDISVTFHYPAFDSPVLSASWTSNPTTFNVGDNFTLALTLTNTGAMDAQNILVNLGFSSLSWGQLAAGNGQSNNIQYSIPSIPIGSSNTTNLGKFLSYTPENAFTLSASYLDTQNFAYKWNTIFSIAANIQTSGPLIVTKTVTPSNPVLGQNGTVTVTIHNTDTSNQYANMLDVTPEAIPFLYPNGPYPGSSNNGFCPNLYNLNGNLTHFTFSFNSYCGSTVVTGVSVARNSTFYPVATPNVPVSGEQWAPLYHYPAGFSPNIYDPLTVQLTFQNSQQYKGYTTVYPYATLPQLGDPSASYLSLDCSIPQTTQCNVLKGGSGAPTLSGVLVNTYGTPISGATIKLGYTTYSSFNIYTTGTLATLTTSSSGTYTFLWSNAPQLAPGSYQLFANYTGTTGHSAQIKYLQVYVVQPFFIGPGQTITMSYPYFFNSTGPITIEPERVTYSTRFNVTFSCGPSCTGSVPILGEFEAESSPVTVNVQAPIIHPVVETTMDTQKLSFVYLAQNQSLVQINLRVTNTGPQTATNVVVSSTIPHLYYQYGSYFGAQLPVADNGNVTVDKINGLVTFNLATLSPGQEASAWYVVQANSTGSTLYQTASNVTAQANGTTFKFGYTGALLAVYFPPKYSQPQAQGSLQSYVTVDPPAITNGTSTTVTVHLFNAGNVTYNTISAALSGSFLPLTFDSTTKSVPDMAPGTSQTVTFTAAASANSYYYGGNSTYVFFYGNVHYNQSKTVGFYTGFSGSVLIYNSKAGFNPSVRIDVSAPTATVSAGAPDIVVVTVSNVGSIPINNLNVGLQTDGPFGTSGTETSYGNLNSNWPNSIAPGQAVKFRVGIETRAGGYYRVFVNQANYNLKDPSCSTNCSNYATISGSTAATITATDTTGPAVTIPWLSPFAPTPSDPENIWTQVSDQSGLSSVNLEYSTDKSTWNSIKMTPLIGSYLNGQDILQIQSTIGDIYNATVPPQNGGTTIFYRIRATDRLGNPTLQDNNGIDFSYTVQGSNSVVVQVPPGTTNYVVNVTQTNPNIGVKTTITLNVSAPISIQVTKLSTNPGGSAPTGTSPLGIYLQINANVSITLQARIRVYYTASQVQGLNVSTVTPYYWDGTKWVALGNVVVNTSGMWVEGTVTHFSLFALFANAASQPPPPPPTPTSGPPWLVIGIVVAVVVVAAVGGLYTTRMRRRGSSTTAPASAPPPASVTSVSPGA